MEELSALGTVIARSTVIDSAPMGPARRRFANAVAILESEFPPPELLAELKRLERGFGRRRGQAWGDRVLDCDILLWTGGPWRSRTLTIPHTGLSQRGFVLGPASAIAANWRDPVTGLATRHHMARLTRPRPLLRDAAWSGR